MNILIATTSFPDKNNKDIGGKFVLNEAAAYAINGMHVKVLTPHQPGAQKKETIQDRLNVIRFRYFFPEKFQRLKTPNKPMYGQRTIIPLLQLPIFLSVFIFQMVKHCQWADIIHCQWTATALLAMPCKWLFKKTIVMTARGSDVRLLPKWLNRFIHANVNAVVDCYGDQKWNNENIKNFPANYIKLPLIVDSKVSALKKMPQDMYEPLKEKGDTFIIVYLGRFDQVKIDDGLPVLTLIDAARILHRDYNKNFHIFYIGDGDIVIKSMMPKRVKQYHLGHCITFLGPKENVNDYLTFCDLGVGGIAFNAVSQEFSCLKKAQLMFEGDYNQETPWKDKINTLFVRVEDITNLADVMAYAMENRVRLEEIGNRAYKMMDHYVKDLNHGGAIYCQAFSEILKKGSN
jgi:glycosyltransferase involved in cell wall biosynthesis